MKINLEDPSNIYIELEPVDYIGTFGGEIDDSYGEYGLQFFSDVADIMFSNIDITQYQKLGLSIINHLIANGHSFELKDDRMGNGEYLMIKH
jgi:hypothetical protein